MIAIIATICLGLSCEDKVVTNSELDTRVSMTWCQMAPAALSEWMKQYPGYSLKGWKCVLGARATGI